MSDPLFSLAGGQFTANRYGVCLGAAVLLGFYITKPLAKRASSAHMLSLVEVRTSYVLVMAAITLGQVSGLQAANYLGLSHSNANYPLLGRLAVEIQLLALSLALGFGALYLVFGSRIAKLMHVTYLITPALALFVLLDAFGHRMNVFAPWLATAALTLFAWNTRPQPEASPLLFLLGATFLLRTLPYALPHALS